MPGGFHLKPPRRRLNELRNRQRIAFHQDHPLRQVAKRISRDVIAEIIRRGIGRQHVLMEFDLPRRQIAQHLFFKCDVDAGQRLLVGRRLVQAWRGRLRNRSDVPIIMLTALGEDVDRIIGLELGADDYVTKPFKSRELIARIRALLRRAGRSAAPGRSGPRVFHFAGWRLNADTRRLYGVDGARVTMTSTEFELLAAFCERPGRVLSRDQLLELTHGGLAGPVERSIDVHISRIRQKIELDPRDPHLIQTVRLGGYLFTSLVDVM